MSYCMKMHRQRKKRWYFFPLHFLKIFLAVLGFDLRASHLLGRQSTTLAIVQTLFMFLLFFLMGSCFLAWSQHQTMSLPICLLPSWDYLIPFLFHLDTYLRPLFLGNSG
jgi:hypothetical protein